MHAAEEPPCCLAGRLPERMCGVPRSRKVVKNRQGAVRRQVLAS